MIPGGIIHRLCLAIGVFLSFFGKEHLFGGSRRGFTHIQGVRLHDQRLAARVGSGRTLRLLGRIAAVVRDSLHVLSDHPSVNGIVDLDMIPRVAVNLLGFTVGIDLVILDHKNLLRGGGGRFAHIERVNGHGNGSSVGILRLGGLRCLCSLGGVLGRGG